MEPIIFCGNDKSNLGEFCFITKNSKLLSSNLSDDRNPTFTSTTYISENFGDYNIRYFSQKKTTVSRPPSTEFFYFFHGSGGVR